MLITKIKNILNSSCIYQFNGINLHHNFKQTTMKISIARQKLTNAGYSITASMQGGYIATKGQRTYKSNSINGLIKLIF